MEVYSELVKLHRAIDLMVEQLIRVHGARLRCGPGCTDCCVDGITVFEVEAERIRREATPVLKARSPAPPGRCAFLDDSGACRIYPQRPYVCRTQGLPLRWIDEDDEVGLVERRDICALNEPGPSVVELPPDQCWSIGPVEERLARLQTEHGQGRLRRVALRDLFPG